MSRPATAAVIVIGNEILSGRTKDANLSYIAAKLGEAGIRVMEARVVPDVEAAIVEAVNTCRGRYGYVFTTGGIGPTHDDITARCIAAAFGVPFGRNEEAERRLRGYYDPDQVNEARLSMADMPLGVELIDNPVSIAPGFRLENVYVLPGVPKILQAMVDGLVGSLEGGTPIASRALTVYAPEGEMAAMLAGVQARFPTLDLGSYPFFRQGRFGTTLVCRGADTLAVAQAHAALVEEATRMGVESAVFDAATARDDALPPGPIRP
ncbi:MAG: competence/damage-inducible protein A [Geminicoccaceae bacterium]|nr:MAG: competence/damage-inducible protein A [Geminicoccaceae bacterium]